ncbi:MAG: TrkA family potassium uptake protein [Desulfobulbaceae bacterium]|nr:TrkA family potassium uptake protein [Desulfobulbaceae bacterium]
MRIVIVGAGDTGRELAGMLARRGGNELIIIDSDEKVCEELAAAIDGLVLHGDGTDPALLKKAGLAEADALVAITSSDPLNTVIAMLGHRLGVANIIVKLNKVGLRPACQEIGVTRIIAPKISAAAEIIAALHGISRLDFSLAVQGGLRLMEIDAGAAAGQTLSQLALDEDLLVVAIQRGQTVHIPRGSVRLEENDILLVLAESREAEERLKKIVTP